MTTKVNFVSCFDGEAEYKVSGGDHDGKTVRVLFATPEFYKSRAAQMPTPSLKMPYETAAILAGTISFQDGTEVPDDVVDMVLSRHWNTQRVYGMSACQSLTAIHKGRDGSWVFGKGSLQQGVHEPQVQAVIPETKRERAVATGLVAG